MNHVLLMNNLHTILHHWPLLVLVGFYASLFVLERCYPLRKASQSGCYRVGTNLMMTMIVIIVVQFSVLPTVEATMAFSKHYHLGLIPLLSLSAPTAFVLGFLLLDLSFYYWHRFNHKTALLWRFHNVHHVDQVLDVTTAMRFHWGEIAYSSIFRFIQLILLGVTPITLFIYEFIFQLCTYFHHSNIRLPKHLDKCLAYLMITPCIHGIHHSNYRQETDSNYGVIFSFWDRLHGSFKQSVSQNDITIGVPAYSMKQDNQLTTLLLMPFSKQRNYWITPKQIVRIKRRIT